MMIIMMTFIIIAQHYVENSVSEKGFGILL